jgi:starch synthase
VTVLFGHPTGNPNSHHAALAHFESGRLEAFCVPWMPTQFELLVLHAMPAMRRYVSRLERRRFAPLAGAPLVQGRVGEWGRMLRRILRTSGSDERVSYEANDWLMRAMRELCSRPAVSAIHSYEDCSCWQFEEAKRLGKACIYDMPTAYYVSRQQTVDEMTRKFAEWLPGGAAGSSRYVRHAQKKKEMELADLVLAPSSFARNSVLESLDKRVALAAYGVDTGFWCEPAEPRKDSSLVFLYAGQCAVQKGTPLLLEAWRAADLKDARLVLAGMWRMNPERQGDLPPRVSVMGPLASSELKALYQSANVFVFPSLFDGFGLVILEAMACGLPVIATDTTAAPDIVDQSNGWVIRSGNLDALVSALREASNLRERLPAMGRAARNRSEQFTWARYRESVKLAVADVI